MSKKITSVLVLVAAVLLSLSSYAQVQKRLHARSAEKQKTEMRTLSEGQKLTAADLAKLKKQALVKAEEAEIAKASMNETERFVSMNLVEMLKADGVARTAKKALSGSRYAAGLVTPPAGVEAETWYTTGGVFRVYGNGGWVDYTSNMSTVKVIVDGTDIYLAGLSYWVPDAYIKGTIDGTTATFASGQQIDDVDPEFIVGSETGEEVTENIVFTYDAAEGTLKAVTPLVMGAIAPNSTSIYEYWQYPEFSKTEPEGPSMELIELPAGATTETWYVTGTTNSGKVPTTAKVAFVDNEVYVQGIFADLPNAWVMGTKTGNSVAFPKLQYLGTYGQYNIWTWTGTIPTDDGYYLLDEVTFTYDEAAKTLTLDEDQAYVATADPTRWYALDYYTDLTLSVDEPVVEPETIPFTADFTKQADFKKFTVIDYNGDGNTWKWDASHYANYPYSMMYDADDYLVVPVAVEAGKNYNVTASAACYLKSYPEAFEVVVGKSANPEDLTTTVIAPTTLTNEEFADFDGGFTADETGIYYVAIHALSEADKFYLMVKSLTVEIGADPTAPAAPSIEAVAFPMGASGAMVTVVPSGKAINGSALEGNTKIELLRDGEVIETYENVVANVPQVYVDKDVTDGSHAYQAIPYNESGIGAKSEKVTVWVGQDLPDNIENVQVTGTTANSLSMTWDPVQPLNGGYINPATVEYSVTTIEIVDFLGFQFPVEGETIGTVTGETAATVDYPMDEGNPNFGYFGVKATVGENSSDATSSMAFALVGAPYELPVLESFTGQALHYVWDYNENTGLGVSADAADDDAVALALTAYEDGEVTFETFKLNVKAAANATLVFSAKKGSSETDKITIYGILPDGTTTDIETVTLTDEYQTYKVVVPAALKAERWARLGFKAELEAETNVLIDDIKILDLYEYDLSIAVAAPKTVVAGGKATIKATVKNEGENAATGYTVTIKAGNEELLTATATESIKMFETAEFTAEFAASIFADAADVAITATVAYTNDLNPDNDEAQTLITVKEPTVPAVTNVTAEANGSSVLVGWVAPDLDAIQAEEVTEDFEEGDGGWTFIDADGDGYNWFYQFGAGADGKKFTAHSGEGIVASESFNNDSGSALTPDNWLVSPDAVLDGTFSFWAVGQDPDYCAEKFQVYVSTTSATDVTTFEPVSELFTATGEYEEYTADLSAYKGAAGWIAIRHYNVTDEFVLVVDDITYLAGAGVSEVDHFNIYLDGKATATAAADAVTATLENVADGEHTVAVSVVYTNGVESKPVATTVTTGGTTGVNSITVITKPVDIYSLDGKLVRKQATTVEGLKGAYIVDGKKVILK